MVSVINPSSTQQHLGAYNSYGGDFQNGYSPYVHPNYGLIPQQLNWPSSLFRSFPRAESNCYPQRTRYTSNKDFSKPLFVDCSIEYELPNASQVPQNSEPILMIHPGYTKKKKPRAYLKPKTSNRSESSVKGPDADKKAAKRSFKEATAPTSRQEFSSGPVLSLNSCCCHCHPVAPKRNRSLFYNQFLQQQEQLLSYQQGLNHFRYNSNNSWT